MLTPASSRSAIEEREEFAQRVSDAVELRFARKRGEYGALAEFVIPKPDPVAEAMMEIGVIPIPDAFRAALASRNLKIVSADHD